MALVHTLPAEPVDVVPLGAALRSTPSSALFKSEQLELMRIVLASGASLPPHAVGGEITVQCIEGAAEVTLDDGAVTLRAGQLLYLPGGCRHGVRALADCSLLLTIVLGRA
jgi:quercetin dioxygenase-like cupin family protein